MGAGKSQWRLAVLVFLGIVLNVYSAKVPIKADISEFLKTSKKAAWTKTAAEFQELNGSKEIYKWNSKQKRSLHYAANDFKGVLVFLEWQLAEADFDFNSDKLDAMTLNFFNKSSAPNKRLAGDKNTFLKFVYQARTALNKFFSYSHGRISIKLINGARVYSCAWNFPWGYAVLKWSYDGSNSHNFLAHYLTLYIYRDKQYFEAAGTTRVASRDELDLKARIKTNAEGDRYLEVPMVDQGKRGYCVVACAERVLKYYNINVDQHILAQAANTSSSRGTTTRDIEESMKSVGARCNFRVDELKEHFSLIGNTKIYSFVKKYNRCARRAGKPKINLKRISTYNQLFNTMDEAVLVETMVEFDSSGYKLFQSRVKDKIDEGMPVLWCVMLGLVKEPKLPQQLGGHMRLIIGYNPKTDEIVYSDSWGKGHGFKKMPWGKAWAMTRMAHVFIPKKN